MAVGGDQQKFAIRGPCGARGPEFVATVSKISVGYLTRGATFGGNNEDLNIAGLEVASAVETIDQAIVSGWRIRPFCAGGRSRQVGEVRTFARNQRRERDHSAVGRPGNRVRRLFEVGDACGLAGVHPTNVKLRLGVRVGEKS